MFWRFKIKFRILFSLADNHFRYYFKTINNSNKIITFKYFYNTL